MDVAPIHLRALAPSQPAARCSSNHLKCPLRIVQPDGYRSLVHKPWPYFEFSCTTFVHRIAFNDFFRIGERISPDDDHAVAIPRFLVVGPIWTRGKHGALFFKPHLKCQVLLDVLHDWSDAVVSPKTLLSCSER